MSVEEFGRAVDLLARQVGHWEAPRWRATAGSGGILPNRGPVEAASVDRDAPPARRDLMHALVQRIADRAADAEGEPRRPVPRLSNDLALTDQLKVVAADLVAAGPAPDLLGAAVADVQETRRAL
ncbi:hypothetical protein [Polymorphospora rubra]|uniref:hypothetical protein n=1 Tax=Polymorphospora rubra TaxID=338584 RepID=UPI0033F7064F